MSSKYIYMDKCCVCNGIVELYDNHVYVCIECGQVQARTQFVPEKDDILLSIQQKTTYKCINYFKRILRCMQDKTNTTISEDILNLVKEEKEKEPETSTHQILKRHKLFKYYIHIPQIDRTLFRTEPIKLSHEVEDWLINSFYRMIVFIKCNYPGRSQCIRYKPVLKRLFAAIGRDDISQTISELKSKKAIHDFNNIWSHFNIDIYSLI